jgi:succinyl-CoA synthetase beta subunit
MLGRLVGRVGLNNVNKVAKNMIMPSAVAFDPMPKYNLNLHEYQSKELMDKFGINIQKWKVATTAEEAFQAHNELNAKETVVKAQIHAGGRGKGMLSSGMKGGV